jgi:tetratricopeptide (TPR) repeat protein
VVTKEQLSVLQTFETAKPSHPLFCHQEFLEKLAEHSRDSIGRRAAFLMQRLSVDARRLHYKATQGINRGWRRSRLGGGGHGSHFYAWWAPQNALPLKESGEFSAAADDAVFLRDIRHHDDHSPLLPQSLDSNYLPVTVRDLRREEYAPLPWTQPQAKFASARQPVRLLKGHPGSGKTTALWNAADSTGAERVLYVTYSRDLAALAQEYFGRFCSSHKQFHVVTFPNLIRKVLGLDSPVVPEHVSRKRFTRELLPFARTLGAWVNSPVALYDEFHAHLVGDALPVAIGRFAACKQPRVPDKAYRDRRTHSLGHGPAAAVLEAAARLERIDSSSLADRYFPELSLAWQAVQRLRTPDHGGDPALLDFDCIAVDECQDLTPIETWFVVELAGLINSQRRTPVPLLLAGDEAQTVRPTDFEWAWLSDLLHTSIGTPSEYKLAANLRSPQRIAGLVNRVWDLYSHIQKQERPSGTGYAEIEDDATDQILYCTAAPGPELDQLLISFSGREGLALIALEDAVPAYVPEPARGAVLTVSEAKGLDFHSVCVLDPGRHIERVLRDDGRLRADSDIEGLRKRLAIDQLRVALSRPTERLFWLDINPTDQVVRQSIAFLNGGNVESGVSSCVPAALLKTLGEDDLDPEERVQRCQADARQYLQVKPEIAWSRAQQAITLLGQPGSMAAVTDEAARNAAYLTLAEVCFTLGLRKTRLADELGKPDLFVEAHRAAVSARRPGLAAIIDAIGKVQRASYESLLHALVSFAQVLSADKDELEPWVLVEIAPKTMHWMEELESALYNGHNAALLIRLLPPFYEALQVSDRTIRIERLKQRAIQLLIKDKQFASALGALRASQERQPKLEAVCLEGMGDFRAAAECHLAAGSVKEALNCYRSIPDFEAALKLVREIGDHPAAESLEWLSKMQQLVAERPEKFTKIVTPAEKKLLQDVLERGLGVSRRKPAQPKPAAKKAPVVRKRAPKAPKKKEKEYF